MRIKWEFVLPFIFFFVIFAGAYFQVFKENSTGSSFFTENYKYYFLEIPYSEHRNPAVARTFHNKAGGWLEKYAENYVRVFSPQFLLYNREDNPSYSLENMGNIYLFEIVFLVVGLYILVRRKWPYYQYVLLLLLIAPIPAALTLNPTSSTRTLLLVPIMSLLIAIGIYQVYLFLEKKRSWYGYAFIFFVVLCYSSSFFKISDEYLTHFPKNRAEHWGYAQKQLVEYLEDNAGSYDEILISRPHETFYIYLMFYSFFDKFFPSEIERYPKSSDGFVYAKSLDKYSFREIKYLDDLMLPNRLIVDKTIDMESLATPSAYFAGYNEFKEPVYVEVSVEETIRLPNGHPVYSILSTSQYKTRRELRNDLQI